MSEGGAIKRRRSFLVQKPSLGRAGEIGAGENEGAAGPLGKFKAVALTASLIARLSKQEKKRQLAREAAVKRLKKEERARRRQEKEERKQLWDSLRRLRDNQIKQEHLNSKS